MPRTEEPKKRAIRICGDCGYELRPDNDGPCPMCERFEQLRIDFTVPRPSDLAAHRADVRHTDVLSAAPDARPPTVAEYRAILAERRDGSTPAGQSRAMVIRTPGLTQIRVPLSGSANKPDEDVSASPVAHRPPGKKEPSSTSRKKAKGRKGKADGRRAARARARSLSAAEENRPPPTGASAAPTSADLPAAGNSAALPRGPQAQSVVAVATESVLTSRQPARPLMRAPPVRRGDPHSRGGAAGPWPVLVAVVAASALIGAAVSILLGSP